MITMLLGVVFVFTANAQEGIVKGNVSDSFSANPISGATITIDGASIEQTTDENGDFVLQNVPVGDQLVKIQMNSYEIQSYPVTVTENKTVDLGSVLMYKDEVEQNDLSVISLSDDELSDDEGGADNTAGLLQASRDVFSSTAAYEFSSTFFRARGYNSENGKLLINGIEMNKIYNGRPQWSDWGGLNDVMRNQTLSNGLAPSEYTFGGLGGSNNINMRASELRSGGRVSYASSNRSYIGRVMASYTAPMNEKGWAYSVLASRRYGNEGYNDATLYDSNSFFVSLEKKINDKHSLNLTAFYTPNRRGKSSSSTQEVYDLGGRTYNSYWGYQDGNKRNSRVREIEEPVFMLNHYWDISDKTTLNTNIAYQTGKIGNSRLDYGGTSIITDTSGNDFIVGGGSNPDPTYYQKLPSYQLREGSLANAYLSQQEFENDGQINWSSLYAANLSSGNSVYALYEDRNDDTQTTFNTIFRTELNDNIDLNASVSYRSLTSKNFANMLDLLGGNGYLNVDSYAVSSTDGISPIVDPTIAQNDLNNPNRLVQEGEKYKYNFEIDANIFDAFAQAQFKYNKVDFYVAGKLSSTNYQRNGLYLNGRFQDNSFGKSKKVEFTNFSAKGGLTYKISGRHLLDFNVGYLTKAPSVRNTFANSRENNVIVNDGNIDDEKITTADASYIIRTPKIKGRLTGYYTQFEDATEISFFYIDGVSGGNETSDFVQEVVTGLDKRNIGLELGIEYQITPTIKLKGAAAIGEYIYNENAENVRIYSDEYSDGYNDFGEASLKNYHVSGGPQKAVSVGFEYRDPDFWWFGATTNYFSNGYVDISPILRTENFSIDPSLPNTQQFNDYDPVLAKELLKQEQFDDYFLVNAVGGKSWKINDNYIGFFATISNILNTKYKTGGYEASRNGNFRELRDDKALDKPVFGSKYWNGYGTSYYLNVYYRF